VEKSPEKKKNEKKKELSVVFVYEMVEYGRMNEWVLVGEERREREREKEMGTVSIAVGLDWIRWAGTFVFSLN